VQKIVRPIDYQLDGGAGQLTNGMPNILNCWMRTARSGVAARWQATFYEIVIPTEGFSPEWRDLR